MKNRTIKTVYNSSDSDTENQITKMKIGCLQELGNLIQPKVYAENLSAEDVDNYIEKSKTPTKRLSSAAPIRSPARTPVCSSRATRQPFSENESAGSDDENIKSTRTKRNEGCSSKRPERKASTNMDYRGFFEDNSQRRMEESWISEICEVDPSKKTPIRLNLKRVRSFDLTRSASKCRDEEDDIVPVDNNPQESPKRKKDDSSDTDIAPRRGLRTRKSLRTLSVSSGSEDANYKLGTTRPKTSQRKENSGGVDAAPGSVTTQETRKTRSSKMKESSSDNDEDDAPRSTRTSKSAKQGRSDSGSMSRRRRQSRKAIESSDEETGLVMRKDPSVNTRTPRATRTSMSGKMGRGRPRRSTVSAQLGCYRAELTSDEGTDVVASEKTPSSRVARSACRGRRSSRFTSTEESIDGGITRMKSNDQTTSVPRSTQTPKSSRQKKTPSARNKGGDDEESLLDSEDGQHTPKRSKASRKSNKTPNKKSPKKAIRNLMATMAERSSSIPEATSSLEVIRSNLHVSAVPESLPCREKEFSDIYRFVGGKICDSAGGCMYISGMPGTGKTATVHAVVRTLKQDMSVGNVPPFQYIEVNGLRLTEPRQVFVRILQQLTGEKCTPQHAQEILAKKFTSGKGLNKAVLLLVDEVDMLRNRRQDVVYNLFDWPSKARSKLIVLTIANTMDLPERLLMGRVTSRLGLTRLTFQPYNFKQLQEIVTARLAGSDCFNPDAVQIVARKVAAVSGDARRALDICRRATELLSGENECVTMAVVNNALNQMMNSASIKTLKACSRMEQLFLQAVVTETKRTGVEETNFFSVYRQLKTICTVNGVKVPNVSEALAVVNRLGSSRILFTEHGKADIMQTIFLNVSSDDIHYALMKPVAA